MMAYLYYKDRTSVVYGMNGLRGVRPLAIRVFRAEPREQLEVMAMHAPHPSCVFIEFEWHSDEAETKRLTRIYRKMSA